MSGNGKQWMIGLGAIVVIAVAGVTVFLVTQPPAAQQQATGAIGAAERHRAEQIKEGDVGVTAPGTATTAPASDAELAEMLGRAPVEVRAMSLAHLTDADRSFVVLRAPDSVNARLFAAADWKTQAEALGRLPADTVGRMVARLPAGDLQRYLESVGVKAADFEHMSYEDRARTVAKADMDALRIVIDRAPAYEVAAALAEFKAAQMRDVVERAPAALKADLVSGSDLEARKLMVQRLPEAERIQLGERLMSVRAQDTALGSAAPDLLLRLYERADARTQADILGSLQAADLGRLFARADPKVQERIVEQVSGRQMERMFAQADRQLLARLVGRAPAEAFVRACERMAPDARAPYLAAMKVSQAAWDSFSKQERIAAVGRLDGARQVEMLASFSPLDQRAVFEQASLAERRDMANRVPEIWSELYPRLDAKSQEALFAIASPAERMAAIRSSDVGRADLTRYLQESERAQFPDLGRMPEP